MGVRYAQIVDTAAARDAYRRQRSELRIFIGRAMLG
jgi:hypothetical protein